MVEVKAGEESMGGAFPEESGEEEEEGGGGEAEEDGEEDIAGPVGADIDAGVADEEGGEEGQPAEASAVSKRIAVRK